VRSREKSDPHSSLRTAAWSCEVAGGEELSRNGEEERWSKAKKDESRQKKEGIFQDALNSRQKWVERAKKGDAASLRSAQTTEENQAPTKKKNEKFSTRKRSHLNNTLIIKRKRSDAPEDRGGRGRREKRGAPVAGAPGLSNLGTFPSGESKRRGKRPRSAGKTSWKVKLLSVENPEAIKGSRRPTSNCRRLLSP